MIRRHLTKYLFLIITLLTVVTAPASAVAPQETSPVAPQHSRKLSDLQSPLPESGNDLEWYSTQLHIHGWSNHNAGSQPGSMQYHTTWAQGEDLDVIWWSDHNKMFVQTMDLPLYLEGAVIVNTLDVEIPNPPGTSPSLRAWQIGYLDATVTGAGRPAVDLDNGVLRMELQSLGNEFASFQYRALNYEQRRVAGHSFVRPLISDPILRFDVTRCSQSGSESSEYVEIRFGLSWHTDGLAKPQELIYRLVPDTEPASVDATSTAVTYTLPVSTAHVERSLLADAMLLPDGDDNSIQELYFEIGARYNKRACMEISEFSISSAQQDPAENWAAEHVVAQRLQTAYGVVEHTGWEQNAGPWHLNPYLPEDAEMAPGWEDLYAPNFVPMVHSLGGIVALNHPFGADYGPLLPEGQQDALVQTRLNTLVPVHAWGIDLMEIYLDRAQVDLAHHLKLWDLLATNGVPLCGLAASDQHGGPLTPDRTHMATWINGPDSSQNSLLSGLTRCRAFFGRVDLFDGIVDLSLGPIAMGGTHPTGPGTGLLQVFVDPLPAGAEVRLVQVEDRTGNQLTYVVDHEPIDPSQPIAIDMSRPGFVRVELWSSDGVPIAFSNRIYLKDPVWTLFIPTVDIH